MFSLFLGLLFCYFLIQKWNFFSSSELSKAYFHLAFTIKLIGGFAFWLVYTYHYTDRATADIFKYFDDALEIAKQTQNNLSLRLQLILGLSSRGAEVNEVLKNTLFWDDSSSLFFNDNRTIIRIHLALLSLSNGFYHFHGLVFAFLSFIGSVFTFKLFERSTAIAQKLLFLACFLLPSFIFWTSAPLKESWLVFCLGAFLFSLFRLLKKRTTLNYLYFFLGVALMLTIKIFILLSLSAGLTFLVLSRKLSIKKQSLVFIAVHLVLLAMLFHSQIIVLLIEQQVIFKKLISKVGANSAIEIAAFSDAFELLQTIPSALFNVMIKPICPPQFSPFSLLASLEHIFYIGILFLPFFYFKQPTKSEVRLSLFCFSFVLVTCTIIGLTTPVLGAIVRYKTPILPFYLILVFTFVDFPALRKSFQKI